MGPGLGNELADSITFNTLRKLDGLVKRGVIEGDVRDCILIIDESNRQATLRGYYLKVRQYIREATPGDDSDREALNQTEADLDMLVRSKQATPVLGQIFALLVFAGITIFRTIITKPSERRASYGSYSTCLRC